MEEQQVDVTHADDGQMKGTGTAGTTQEGPAKHEEGLRKLTRG
jgi:hypothetical protein